MQVDYDTTELPSWLTKGLCMFEWVIWRHLAAREQVGTVVTLHVAYLNIQLKYFILVVEYKTHSK